MHILDIYQGGYSRQGINKCAIFQNRTYDSGLFYNDTKGKLVLHVQGNNHKEKTYQ